MDNVWRMSDEIIDVNGTFVMKSNPNEEDWELLSGESIDYIDAQSLLELLENEEEEKRERFNSYLDLIIKKLIYNQNED